VKEERVICAVKPSVSKLPAFLSQYVISLPAVLTLNLPTTTIVAQPFNIIKWQLKFNPVNKRM